MTKSRKRPCKNANQEKQKSSKHKPPNSLNEQLFNRLIGKYAEVRKGLVKDKLGIRLEICQCNEQNSAENIKFNKNKGMYTVEVQTTQLKLNNNILKFRCYVYNDRKDDVLVLTAAAILDASSLISCYDDNNNWMETKEFIKIEPKKSYDHIVIAFRIVEPVISSCLIPFAINLKEDNKDANVTLCRTILLNIVDPKTHNVSGETEKSPFTGLLWHCKHLILNIGSESREELTGYKFIPYEWTGLQSKSKESIVLESLRKMDNPKQTTKDNYAEKFHNCLWLEEITNRIMLQHYNMENVTMTVIGDFLKLKVPGLEEKRPNLIIGDRIHVRAHDDHTGYVGTVNKLEYHHVIIDGIHSELRELIYDIPETELDVSFQLGTLPLERAHRGIEDVCDKGIVESLFIVDVESTAPVSIGRLKDSDFKNQKITSNYEQRTAVENILKCTSGRAPYIVYGPPGTGKTVTIVEAIYQILRRTKKTILVCAPSNAACDMLTTKLIQYCREGEIIRVHSQARDKSTIPEEIRPFSNFVSEDNVYVVKSETLRKYRIVVTTLILIGKYSTVDSMEQPYEADFVFIDEAAQASEPDTCVALARMKSKGNIVLAGDPKQLGPIIQSTNAQEYGLDISLLERLMAEQTKYAANDPNYITMLKGNYRSHADILRIPNKLFYQSKLRAVSEESNNHPVSKFDVYSNIKKLQSTLKKGKRRLHISGRAVEFVAVSSEECREGQSPSYFNESEADMVIECVKTLVQAQFEKGFQIKLSDIGVITPYIRQVYKIKALLELNNFKDVEVGSTEAFQGREKRVIIISTVRAQNNLLMEDEYYNLGFVKHDKRFNVALTRAMSKLIVIGCPTVLGTDSKWKEYIEECRHMGSYHGFPFEERTKDKMNEIVEIFQRFPPLSV